MNRKSSVSVEWAPHSRQDVLDIYAYLVSERGPDLAEDTVFRIQDVGNKLRLHPLLWKERKELQNLRLAPVYPYYICYRLERNLAEIVRVVHDARDLIAIFNGKPL